MVYEVKCVTKHWEVLSTTSKTGKVREVEGVCFP